MQKAFIFFFFIAAGFIGFKFGSGQLQSVYPFSSGAKCVEGIRPELEFPATEFKSFVIVVYAQNDACWCEEALRSIFAQDYDYFRVILVDDGSLDGTLERAKEFIIANAQEHRVLVMENEQACGLSASIYRAAGHCLDREIIVPILAKDWMVSSSVLSHWNRAFQNPDVWMAFGRAMRYPSYEFQDPPKFDLRVDGKEVAKKGWGKWVSEDYPCHCFYSALYKQVPIKHLEGNHLLPLLELAGGRVKNVWEPLSFVNETKRACKRSTTQNLTVLKPLTTFPKHWNNEPLEVDAVVFSHNQPLKLFAALEAISRNVKGLQRIVAAYWADPPYQLAYEELKSFFPDVLFLPQGKEFKRSLFTRVLETPAQYIVLGTDNAILKEGVDLSKSAALLHRTRANAFFFAPGATNGGTPLSDGVFASTLSQRGVSAHLEMALYSKSEIGHVLKALRYENLTDVELATLTFFSKEAVCLFYGASKIVPLNIGREEELLSTFNQGLKIDVEHIGPGESPEFILR